MCIYIYMYMYTYIYNVDRDPGAGAAAPGGHVLAIAPTAAFVYARNRATFLSFDRILKCSM